MSLPNFNGNNFNDSTNFDHVNFAAHNAGLLSNNSSASNSRPVSMSPLESGGSAVIMSIPEETFSEDEETDDSDYMLDQPIMDLSKPFSRQGRPDSVTTNIMNPSHKLNTNVTMDSPLSTNLPSLQQTTFSPPNIGTPLDSVDDVANFGGEEGSGEFDDLDNLTAMLDNVDTLDSQYLKSEKIDHKRKNSVFSGGYQFYSEVDKNVHEVCKIDDLDNVDGGLIERMNQALQDNSSEEDLHLEDLNSAQEILSASEFSDSSNLTPVIKKSDKGWRSSSRASRKIGNSWVNAVAGVKETPMNLMPALKEESSEDEHVSRSRRESRRWSAIKKKIEKLDDMAEHIDEEKMAEAMAIGGNKIDITTNVQKMLENVDITEEAHKTDRDSTTMLGAMYNRINAQISKEGSEHINVMDSVITDGGYMSQSGTDISNGHKSKTWHEFFNDAGLFQTNLANDNATIITDSSSQVEIPSALNELDISEIQGFLSMNSKSSHSKNFLRREIDRLQLKQDYDEALRSVYRTQVHQLISEIQPQSPVIDDDSMSFSVPESFMDIKIDERVKIVYVSKKIALINELFAKLFLTYGEASFAHYLLQESVLLRRTLRKALFPESQGDITVVSIEKAGSDSDLLKIIGEYPHIVFIDEDLNLLTQKTAEAHDEFFGITLQLEKRAWDALVDVSVGLVRSKMHRQRNSSPKYKALLRIMDPALKLTIEPDFYDEKFNLLYSTHVDVMLMSLNEKFTKGLAFEEIFSEKFAIFLKSIPISTPFHSSIYKNIISTTRRLSCVPGFDYNSLTSKRYLENRRKDIAEMSPANRSFYDSFSVWMERQYDKYFELLYSVSSVFELPLFFGDICMFLGELALDREANELAFNFSVQSISFFLQFLQQTQQTRDDLRFELEQRDAPMNVIPEGVEAKENGYVERLSAEHEEYKIWYEYQVYIIDDITKSCMALEKRISDTWRVLFTSMSFRYSKSKLFDMLRQACGSAGVQTVPYLAGGFLNNEMSDKDREWIDAVELFTISPSLTRQIKANYAKMQLDRPIDHMDRQLYLLQRALSVFYQMSSEAVSDNPFEQLPQLLDDLRESSDMVNSSELKTVEKCLAEICMINRTYAVTLVQEGQLIQAKHVLEDTLEISNVLSKKDVYIRVWTALVQIVCLIAARSRFYLNHLSTERLRRGKKVDDDMDMPIAIDRNIFTNKDLSIVKNMVTEEEIEKRFCDISASFQFLADCYRLRPKSIQPLMGLYEDFPLKESNYKFLIKNASKVSKVRNGKYLNAIFLVIAEIKKFPVKYQKQFFEMVFADFFYTKQTKELQEIMKIHQLEAGEFNLEDNFDEAEEEEFDYEFGEEFEIDDSTAGYTLGNEINPSTMISEEIHLVAKEFDAMQTMQSIPKSKDMIRRKSIAAALKTATENTLIKGDSLKSTADATPLRQFVMLQRQRQQNINNPSQYAENSENGPDEYESMSEGELPADEPQPSQYTKKLSVNSNPFGNGVANLQRRRRSIFAPVAAKMNDHVTESGVDLNVNNTEMPQLSVEAQNWKESRRGTIFGQLNTERRMSILDSPEPSTYYSGSEIDSDELDIQEEIAQNMSAIRKSMNFNSLKIDNVKDLVGMVMAGKKDSIGAGGNVFNTMKQLEDEGHDMNDGHMQMGESVDIESLLPKQQNIPQPNQLGLTGVEINFNDLFDIDMVRELLHMHPLFIYSCFELALLYKENDLVDLAKQLLLECLDYSIVVLKPKDSFFTDIWECLNDLCTHSENPYEYLGFLNAELIRYIREFSLSENHILFVILNDLIDRLQTDILSHIRYFYNLQMQKENLSRAIPQRIFALNAEYVSIFLQHKSESDAAMILKRSLDLYRSIHVKKFERYKKKKIVEKFETDPNYVDVWIQYADLQHIIAMKKRNEQKFQEAVDVLTKTLDCRPIEMDPREPKPSAVIIAIVKTLEEWRSVAFQQRAVLESKAYKYLFSLYRKVDQEMRFHGIFMEYDACAPLKSPKKYQDYLQILNKHTYLPMVLQYLIDYTADGQLPQMSLQYCRELLTIFCIISVPVEDFVNLWKITKEVYMAQGRGNRDLISFIEAELEQRSIVLPSHHFVLKHIEYDLHELKTKGQRFEKWFVAIGYYIFYILIFLFFYFVAPAPTELISFWNERTSWTYFLIWLVEFGLMFMALYFCDWPNLPAESDRARMLARQERETKLEDGCLLIACHRSEETVEATLHAALQVFKPNKIYICDNANSPVPLDNTKLVCQRLSRSYCKQHGMSYSEDNSINYIWVPEGNKTTSFWWTTRYIVKEKYVMMTDDDVMLPPDIAIPTHKMEDGVTKALAFTISADNKFDDKGKPILVAHYQDLEYKLAGFIKMFQCLLGSSLSAHGAVAMWEREVLLEVFARHNQTFNGEDLQMGILLQGLNKNYRMECVGTVCVPTTVPDHAICRKTLWCRCGEYSLLRQRVRSWDPTAHRFIPIFIYLILFYWRRNTLILKPFLMYELWTSIMDWVRLFLVAYLVWVNPLTFFIGLTSLYLIYICILCLFNYWTLRNRPDLRAEFPTVITFPFYRYMILVFRMLAVMYNLLYYTPFFRNRRKIKDRNDLPISPDEAAYLADHERKLKEEAAAFRKALYDDSEDEANATKGLVIEDHDIDSINVAQNPFRQLVIMLDDLRSSVDAEYFIKEEDQVSFLARSWFESILVPIIRAERFQCLPPAFVNDTELASNINLIHEHFYPDTSFAPHFSLLLNAMCVFTNIPRVVGNDITRATKTMMWLTVEMFAKLQTNGIVTQNDVIKLKRDLNNSKGIDVPTFVRATNKMAIPSIHVVAPNSCSDPRPQTFVVSPRRAGETFGLDVLSLASEINYDDIVFETYIHEFLAEISEPLKTMVFFVPLQPAGSFKMDRSCMYAGIFVAPSEGLIIVNAPAVLTNSPEMNNIYAVLSLIKTMHPSLLLDRYITTIVQSGPSRFITWDTISKQAGKYFDGFPKEFASIKPNSSFQTGFARRLSVARSSTLTSGMPSTNQSRRMSFIPGADRDIQVSRRQSFRDQNANVITMQQERNFSNAPSVSEAAKRNIPDAEIDGSLYSIPSSCLDVDSDLDVIYPEDEVELVEENVVSVLSDKPEVFQFDRVTDDGLWFRPILEILRCPLIVLNGKNPLIGGSFLRTINQDQVLEIILLIQCEVDGSHMEFMPIVPDPSSLTYQRARRFLFTLKENMDEY
ncbi:hypothetical protein PCE1_000707 [Barthelona sp. PCE]